MNDNTELSFRKLYSFGKKLPIDLSLSENPLGCSPEVSKTVKELSQSDFFNYPDPDCNRLKKAIAKRFQLDLDGIFVANGSEALIKQLPQVIINQGDEVIIPRVTFPMFEIASKMSNGKVVFSEMTKNFDIDLRDIKSRISNNTKLIFLCNPNNPTGRIISKKAILDFINSIKATVVVDEANIEFGGESLIEETKKIKNLVILRTFSKGFGLAGLRIGFCVANNELIRLLQQSSQPFPVSTIAETAALTAFADTTFIEKTRQFMKGEKDFLIRELSKRGFRVVKSQANNLLVIIPFAMTDLVSKLNKNGVSVVDDSSFNLKNIRFIRVSPRLRIINKRFIRIIDQIISEDI